MAAMLRTWRFVVIVAALAATGCAALPPPAPEYSDPLAGIPRVAGSTATSSLRLGLVISENGRKAMAYVEDRQKAYRAYGGFTNATAMSDESPAAMVTALTQMLQSRFQSVVRLDGQSPADLQKVDVAMVLDLQVSIGSMSGQKTDVKITGVFLDSQGQLVDTVSGQGQKTVPYPARTAQFRPAWQTALQAFQTQLDGSAKVAALGRQTTGSSEHAVAAANKPARAEEPVAGPVGQRWAVVVGISEYKFAGKKLPNLKYAARDAKDLADFLKSDSGGNFAADHVMLLTDKAATKEGITDALFNFLKHTVKEDMVIIHFSGHGTPDPEKLSNLYIVAYDTDPDKVASTGFPMWDLDTALHRSIAAQRVIVLADTCHSAGVTEGVKGVQVGSSFNKYFEELSKSKPGRVTFTSCEGYESSMEADKWGGGHGVFTWAILEALRGKADVNKDGIVTLGEMLDYVDVTVRRETANEQHPARAGVQFDRNLPMGVVK